MLKQCLCVPLGQSICASIFHALPFCVGAQLGVPYISMLVSCHTCLVFCTLERTALFLRGASPWTSTSCPEPYPNWILPKRFPSRPKPALLKSRVVILLLALFISLKIFNSTVLCLLQPHLWPACFCLWQVQQDISPGIFLPWYASGSPHTFCLLLVVILAIGCSR